MVPHISIISGGENPVNRTVLGKTLCEACRHRHGRDAKGGSGEQRVSSMKILRILQIFFPSRLANNVNNSYNHGPVGARNLNGHPPMCPSFFMHENLATPLLK